MSRIERLKDDLGGIGNCELGNRDGTGAERGEHRGLLGHDLAWALGRLECLRSWTGDCPGDHFDDAKGVPIDRDGDHSQGRRRRWVARPRRCRTPSADSRALAALTDAEPRPVRRSVEESDNGRDGGRAIPASRTISSSIPGGCDQALPEP